MQDKTQVKDQDNKMEEAWQLPAHTFMDKRSKHKACHRRILREV